VSPGTFPGDGKNPALKGWARDKECKTNLTAEDLANLSKSFVTPEIARAAGLFRVNSIDGSEIVGRRTGDCAGIVFPYHAPDTGQVVLHRLRLDHPPVDAVSGKPEHKYLQPPGARNRLYLPPCDLALPRDPTLEIVLTEGEKKCLGLWSAALESSNGSGKPSFLPLGLGGVWNWKGTVGIRSNAKGQRVPERGITPDFDRIVWTARKVTILFDANAATNDSVSAARRQLAAELTRRGADVWIADLPIVAGVNGIDDYLAEFGLNKGLEILQQAVRYDWRADLIRSATGRILANLANAITALRGAPEWCGLLAFNEFALSVTTIRSTPWGHVAEWSEQDDRLCANWMQHRGIQVKDVEVAKAVETVARDRSYHPVREYLEQLKWDGTGRLDQWLILYLGASQSELIQAIGSKWIISGVARIYKPGCKADHCLIIEGPQGSLKSSAVRELAPEWFTDDMPELGTKDAALATIGAWIMELAELDAMTRADVSRIKAFISRSTDRFRPPYGRRMIESPRQCIFAGTVNSSQYLRDETGGRRFWPVTCGRINLDALRRDRDQLWAEAVTRYKRGESWWLEEPALIEAAAEEQETRYSADPWEEPIAAFLSNRTIPVTTADVLRLAIEKPRGQWTRADETRVGAILLRLGCTRGPREPTGSRRRTYEPP
jgi:predicted P-loop ATPase